MIGGAVYLAATGFANLVESFKGMEPTQMLAMGLSLGIIAAGIYVLTAALVSAGIAAVPALVGIGVLTGAILALGHATQSFKYWRVR